MNNFKGFPIFGNDGLGDFEFSEKIITEVDRSLSAAAALINFVKLYPGNLIGLKN